MSDGAIQGNVGVPKAKVLLGEDRVLRVEIDLNFPEGQEVEARIGAYGTMEYATEILHKYFWIREMQKAQKEAKMKGATGIVKPGVIDTSKFH